MCALFNIIILSNTRTNKQIYLNEISNNQLSYKFELEIRHWNYRKSSMFRKLVWGMDVYPREKINRFWNRMFASVQSMTFFLRKSRIVEKWTFVKCQSEALTGKQKMKISWLLFLFWKTKEKWLPVRRNELNCIHHDSWLSMYTYICVMRIFRRLFCYRWLFFAGYLVGWHEECSIKMAKTSDRRLFVVKQCNQFPCIDMFRRIHFGKYLNIRIKRTIAAIVFIHLAWLVYIS